MEAPEVTPLRKLADQLTDVLQGFGLLENDKRVLSGDALLKWLVQLPKTGDRIKSYLQPLDSLEIGMGTTIDDYDGDLNSSYYED